MATDQTVIRLLVVIVPLMATAQRVPHTVIRVLLVVTVPAMATVIQPRAATVLRMVTVPSVIPRPVEIAPATVTVMAVLLVEIVLRMVIVRSVIPRPAVIVPLTAIGTVEHLVVTVPLMATVRRVLLMVIQVRLEETVPLMATAMGVRLVATARPTVIVTVELLAVIAHPTEIVQIVQLVPRTVIRVRLVATALRMATVRSVILRLEETVLLMATAMGVRLVVTVLRMGIARSVILHPEVIARPTEIVQLVPPMVIPARPVEIARPMAAAMAVLPEVTVPRMATVQIVPHVPPTVIARSVTQLLAEIVLRTVTRLRAPATEIDQSVRVRLRTHVLGLGVSARNVFVEVS